MVAINEDSFLMTSLHDQIDFIHGQLSITESNIEGKGFSIFENFPNKISTICRYFSIFL